MTKRPGLTILLPKDEAQLLSEEVAGSNRSESAIITEALRLRRVVLDALGIQEAGTEPGEIARIATKVIKRGRQNRAEKGAGNAK